MSKPKEHAYISCCSHSKPEWAMSLTIQDVMRYSAKHGMSTTFSPRTGEALIDRARNNEVVELLRRSSCEWFFSVDDDLVFPQNALIELKKQDKDIIGGVYRLKYDEPQLAIRVSRNGAKWDKILKKDLVVPAIYVSTGCMLVKRSVIETMVEKYEELMYTRNMTADKGYALFMPYIYRDEYLSEDWAFCQRAKDLGFEVWAHGGVKLGHWGKKLYRF